MISIPAGDTCKLETDQVLLEGVSILGKKNIKTSLFQCKNDTLTSQI
jgi:hypothetical protein